MPRLATKLYLPPPRPGLVHRPRLMERLNEGLRRKLILVSAPAGFGKTTLISEWIHNMQSLELGPMAQLSNTNVRPFFAWLSLDQGDNDIAQFLSYMIAALQMVEPEIGQGVMRLLHTDQFQVIPTETLMITLLNELASASAEIILVLDDYHAIENQAIHHACTFFLDHLPSQIHLVLTSRADPPLSLARLRVHGEIIEIRAADLRFTADEVLDFLNQIMGLELLPDDLRALENRTEGWIAGLHLAALSLQGLSPASQRDFVATFSGDDRYIVDYLVEEVLNRQTSEIQSFLLQTSILDRLCGPLCDAVTDRRDSQAVLHFLDRANLFIVPLDNKRIWYRYHQLMAELLRYRFEETYPHRAHDLHRRASAWYWQSGLKTEAIDHAFEAEDFDRAAEMIEQVAHLQFAEGGFRRLEGWLARFPEEIISARPGLSLIYVWTRFRMAQWEAAEASLQHFEARYGTGINQQKAGEVAALHAYLALFKEDYPKCVQMAQQALALLPSENRYLRSVTYSALGSAYRLMGEVLLAEEAYIQVIRYSQQDNYVIGSPYGLGLLLITQSTRGHLQQAARTYQEIMQAMKDWPAGRGSLPPPTGAAMIGFGEVLREWNELDAAADHLSRGIETYRQWGGSMDIVLEGYFSLARVQQTQGSLTEAFGTLRDAEQYLEQGHTSRQGLALLEAYRTRLWLSAAHLDLPAAREWGQRCGLMPEDALNAQREFEYLTLARLLLADGEPDRAVQLLSRLKQAASEAGRMRCVLECLVLQALALQEQNKIDHALMILREALSLAEPEGYLRLFLDEGKPMIALLQQAAVHHIAVDYVQNCLSIMETEWQRMGRVDENPETLARKWLKAQHAHSSEFMEPLSQRELEVLRLLNTELTSQEIATELVISVNTVKTHLKRIYGKLNARSRYEAIDRAKELKLI